MISGIPETMRSKSGTRPGACSLAVLLLSLVVACASSVPAAPENLSGLPLSGGWPLFFEPLAGESGFATNFLVRAPNYQLIVEPGEVNFLLQQPIAVAAAVDVRRDKSLQLAKGEAHALRLALLGASDRARIFGSAEMSGKINYLVGSDPSQWRSQVPMFGRVKVEAIYPGIDVEYYANQRQLEYDFTIAPHGDPALIRLRFEGVQRLSLSASGELVISLGDAELRQHTPRVYQVIHGVRREIQARYEIKDSQTFGFAVGPYHPDLPLVIDPVFSYATYFGGNAGDTGLAVKVDNTGSVYIAGETLSTQIAWANSGSAFQSQLKGGASTGDAFVAKLDSTGSHLVYFTYLGGSADDGAYDLAIDASGNAYITGFTESPDFPTKAALFSTISGSADSTFHVLPPDAFVAEINTNGSALIYSTYLGGTGRDLGSSIAVDPAGYAYVAGYTFSTNFPLHNALQSSLAGNDDVFVAKIAPGGRNLVYSTYLGGRSIDEGEGIAADADGFAYVAGYTASVNFPITPNAAQTNLNGTGAAITVFDGFVTKISPYGTNLIYSTYLGGEENDFAYRIALDSSRNAYVTGTTQSTNFPHADVFGLSLGENGTNIVNFDAFLTKLDTNGMPAYSAQFGGTLNDSGWDVAVDPAGRAFVIGLTLSTNFPVVQPFDLFRGTNSGGTDIFVVAFNTNGSAVLYSGYLGGSGNDYGYGIAVDAEANAYISGMTLSSSFPETAAAPQRALQGASDAFVAKIRLHDPMLSVQTVGGLVQLSWPATAPDYVLQSTTDLAAPQTWTTVSQPPGLANGQYQVTLVITNATTLFRLHHP